MRSPLLSFSCVLLYTSLIRLAAASCYYPDGSFPDDYVYVPCSGDEFTSCCILSEGDQCLSNGLCLYPSKSNPYMFRGACTDKSWNSSNCFQHCKTGGSSRSSWDELVSCGGDKYCCYSDGSTCCNDDSKVFTLGAVSVIKDLATTGTYTLPIATATATGISKSLNAKITNTESNEAKTTGSKASTTTSIATGTATSTNIQASSDNHPQSTSHLSLIVGAISGIVILIIAVASVWFFVRRRYKKKLEANVNNQSYPMSNDGFQKLPDKSPRPVEIPAPIHSPAPPYQPPPYQSPPPHNNAVEMDSSFLPPARNQWGQPVFEAPAHPIRQ